MIIRSLYIAVSFYAFAIYADESALCSDLARFSCAPGTYNDGTGEVKSFAQVQQAISVYSNKIRDDLAGKLTAAINDPDNPYFRDLSIAALGLKNSPACMGKSPENLGECDKNVTEGLTRLAETIVLGPLVPQTGLEGRGNLKDMWDIVKSATFNDIILDANKKLQSDLGKPEMLSKVEKEIFPRVKELILSRIDKLKISDKQKTFMKTKLKSIGFDGTDCSSIAEASRQSNLVANLLQNNAYYNPERNRFTFCAGYLMQTTSEFSLAFVIAHELFHSLDPCTINHGPHDLGFKYSDGADLAKMESEYPISNVVRCLRDSRSVNAVNIKHLMVSQQQSQNEGSAGGESQVVRPNQVIGRKIRGSQPQPNETFTFCDHDQMTEAMPDWMAAEILPEYIDKYHPSLNVDQRRVGYSNALRLLCFNPATPMVLRVHPQSENRINGILLAQPMIRKHMGCVSSPKSVYCDADRPPDIPWAPNKGPIPGVMPNNGIRGVK